MLIPILNHQTSWEKIVKKILLISAIAALAIAAVNKPAEFLTSDGAGYTLNSGIDAVALSTSPETNPIQNYTPNGIFDQIELNVLVSSGTTTGVSITTYHSPAGATGTEPAAATYGQTTRCANQGLGVDVCYPHVKYYPFASGTSHHFSTLIPGNSRFTKVKFEGPGNSDITVTGIKFVN